MTSGCSTLEPVNGRLGKKGLRKAARARTSARARKAARARLEFGFVLRSFSFVRVGRVKKDFLSACTVALIEVNCLFSELAVTSSVASSATRVYFPGPGAHKTTKTQQNNTKQNTQKQKTKKTNKT